MDSPTPAPRRSPPKPAGPSRKGLSPRGFAILLMPPLTVVAFYCLWGLGISGGLFEYLSELSAQESPFFPGSEDPLRTEFTGVKFIDGQLATLGPFFAPIARRSSTPLNLFTLWMIGQIGAGWTLLVLESLRKGNSWRASSFVGTYGILFQSFGFALITPIFLLIHLLTSPIAKPFPSKNATTVLLVPTVDLAVLPISVVLGFFVPTVLAALHAPSVVTTDTQQILLALWQPFPFWTVVIHFILRNFVSLFVRQDSQTQKKVDSPSAVYLKAVAPVYMFVLGMCILTHIPIVLLTMVPSSMLSFSPTLASVGDTSFSSVFIPPAPLPSWRMTSLSNAVHVFLLWDAYISAVTTILWATVLWLNYSTEGEIVDPKTGSPIMWGTTGRNNRVWWKAVGKILGWTVLAGPFASVAVLLWERDEIVRMKVKRGV